MAIDFNNPEAVVGGISKILQLPTGPPPPIPTAIILIGVPKRNGLSPITIANNIIARKPEAGIPLGTLPSGADNPEELMWRIVIEEIVNAFQQDAIISVAVPPGIALTAAGISPAGPVSVVGSTVGYIKGYGVIQ